jgi:hypothetical protein
MAVITRFVNTGSAGGDGTTTALSGAQAAYVSLSACETAEDTDLTDAGGDTMIINCAGTAADTNSFTFGGWVTSATCTITVNGDYAVTSGNHYSTSYYRLESASQTVTVATDYVYLNKLQIKNTAATGTAQQALYYNQSIGNVNQCVVVTNHTGDSAGTAILVYGTAGETVNINNCVVYGANSTTGADYGIRQIVAGTLNINNCTVSGFPTAGILRSAGTVVVTNCAVFNNADDISGTVTLTYSAGDDADFDSGTGNVALADSAESWNAQFVAYTTGNFHIVVGSALINAASDLSGTFTVDIDGNTRVAWDIGADEYISTGATATAHSIVKAPTTTGVGSKAKRSTSTSIVKAPLSSGVGRKTKHSVTVSTVKAPISVAVGSVVTAGAFYATATIIVKAPTSTAICHVHRSATGASIIKAPVSTATLRRGKRCTATSIVKAPTSVATAVVVASGVFNTVASSIVRGPRSTATGRLTRNCTATSIVKAPSVSMSGTAGATGTQLDRIEQLIYVLMAIKS